MNKEELQQYILAGIFNETPTNIPRYVEDLDPEMFDGRNRDMFISLLGGERDIKTLSEKSKWSLTKIVDLMLGENNNKFLTEGLIKEFKEVSLKDEAVKALQNNEWSKLNDISNKIQSTPRLDPVKSYEEFKKQFKEIANKGRLGASTGLVDLDEATKGFIPGHIWVCGAYYGQGKTYLAINFMNSLLEQGKRVMFISLEMPPEEIIQRFVALRAGLNLMETISDVDEYKRTKREIAEKFIMEKIQSGDLLLDSDSRDINSTLSNIFREDMKRHVDVVAIDYIQLLANPGKQYESISEAVQRLQGLAKKIKTTVIMLSQVSNASQKEGDGRVVDGFKGAGDIGQVANVAIRIERDRDDKTGEYSDYFGIRLTKIRHGRPTKVDAILDFPGGRIRKPKEGEIVEKVKPMTKAERILASFEEL